MGEASGMVAIKAPKEITDAFFTESSSLPWVAVSQLFSFAGIESLNDSHSDLNYWGKRDFHLEGDTELLGDFTMVTPFGSEWMGICEALTKKGAGVELYGVIFSEYGTSDYFLISGETRYHQRVDWEISKNTDRVKEIVKEWKSCPA